MRKMHSPRSKAKRRGRTAMKTAVFALVLALPTVVSSTVALAAPEVNCNGVFTGLTPSDPIVKTADKATALPGETVTYTVTWTPNGADDVSFVDCFRVGTGLDATLNGIVTGGNVEYDGANDGTEVFSVAIPNDPALIGQTVVDRVKCGQGCRESKSGLIAVAVVAPPEICDDSIDNDLDGQTDEGCTVIPPGDDDDVVPPGDDDDVPPPGDDDDVVPPGDDDDVPPPGDDDDVVPPGDDDDVPPPGDDDDVPPPGDDDDVVPPGDDDVAPPTGDDDEVDVGDNTGSDGSDGNDDSTGSNPDEDDDSRPTRVLGVINTRPALATTGVGTKAAWYGVLFLAAGLALRFGKFRRIQRVPAVRTTAGMAFGLTATPFGGLSPPFRWRVHGARAPDRRRSCRRT